MNNEDSKLAAKGVISVADIFKSRKALQPENEASETKSVARSYQSNANLSGNQRAQALIEHMKQKQF